MHVIMEVETDGDWRLVALISDDDAEYARTHLKQHGEDHGYEVIDLGDMSVDIKALVENLNKDGG